MVYNSFYIATKFIKCLSQCAFILNKMFLKVIDLYIKVIKL